MLEWGLQAKVGGEVTLQGRGFVKKKTNVLSERSQSQRTPDCMIPLTVHEVSRIGKFIGTGSTLMVTRNWGEGLRGKGETAGEYEFLLGVLKIF